MGNVIDCLASISLQFFHLFLKCRTSVSGPDNRTLFCRSELARCRPLLAAWDTLLAAATL